MQPYHRHLRSAADLITTNVATRAVVRHALRWKRIVARRLTCLKPDTSSSMAMQAKTPADLLQMKDIQVGLLMAAGLSDKALTYLKPEDKTQAIQRLIEEFLEPAGAKFVEELVFRFLLTRGDALGGIDAQYRRFAGAGEAHPYASRRIDGGRHHLPLAGWQDSRMVRNGGSRCRYGGKAARHSLAAQRWRSLTRL